MNNKPTKLGLTEQLVLDQNREDTRNHTLRRKARGKWIKQIDKKLKLASKALVAHKGTDDMELITLVNHSYAALHIGATDLVTSMYWKGHLVAALPFSPSASHWLYLIPEQAAFAVKIDNIESDTVCYAMMPTVQLVDHYSSYVCSDVSMVSVAPGLTDFVGWLDQLIVDPSYRI